MLYPLTRNILNNNIYIYIYIMSLRIRSTNSSINEGGVFIATNSNIRSAIIRYLQQNV